MTLKIQGFDVGGSSVKAGLVDVEGGRLIGELISAPTPKPATPEGVMQVIAGLSRSMPEAGTGVGIALPSVVQKGKVRTAANIDHSWIGTDAAALAAKVLGRPAECLNDADAAGFAEMRWGAGKGETGMVFMLTFGTGIGSALFYGGTAGSQHGVGSSGNARHGRRKVGLGAREDGAESRLAGVDRARQRVPRPHARAILA